MQRSFLFSPHTATGTRATHCNRIAEAVRRNPDRCCREIARIVDLEPYEVSKRLSDLHGQGRLRVSGETTRSGRRARTWRAVP